MFYKFVALWKIVNISQKLFFCERIIADIIYQVTFILFGIFHKAETFICIYCNDLMTNYVIWKNNCRELPFFTWYSVLNSCSKNESRRSSQESSKAVRIGSLDDSAIKEGDANAR